MVLARYLMIFRVLLEVSANKKVRTENNLRNMKAKERKLMV